MLFENYYDTKHHDPTVLAIGPQSVSSANVISHHSASEAVPLYRSLCLFNGGADWHDA
jgi:hypothetical protein